MTGPLTGPSTRRLFVAVDPPAVAVAELRSVVETLAVSRAGGVKLSPPDRWHVTLAFLGETPAELVGAAATALERAARATLVRRVTPITLRIAGGGTFGRERSTILWASIAGAVADLRTLAVAVRDELTSGGLTYDDRPLRPHLTLARPGDRITAAAVADDVARLDAYRGADWVVDAIHLVESDFRVTPAGTEPRYTRLHSVPLP